MITIKEIAKLADVSPSTVSIVLNNKAKERSISEETVARVWAIAAENGYRPNVRTVGLRVKCADAGMNDPYAYITPATLAGGYEATVQALKEHPEIGSIFYASDILAVGSLRYFNENKINVPQDIEFIAAGNYEDSWSECVYPSISVVRLPIEEMAAECLRTLHELMNYRTPDNNSISLKTSYIARMSSPEMS